MLNYSIDTVNYFTDNSTRYTKTHKRNFFVSYNDNVKLNDKIKDIKITLRAILLIVLTYVSVDNG